MCKEKHPRLMKWTPDLIIAAFVIVAGVALRCFGINSEVWAMVLLACGWVFGGQYQNRKLLMMEIKNGKPNC